MKTYSISEFMNRDERKTDYKKIAIYTGATTLTLLLIPDVTLAASSIDAGAKIIYSKILEVGKWIIIIKGALDTINNVVQGDFNSAKKSFFGYLIVYMVLHALPWAMDEVDNIFKTI